MSAEENHNWYEANQCYLTARLSLVRLALQAYAAQDGRGASDALMSEEALAAAEQSLREAEAALPSGAALDHLCSAFGLSPFEKDVLLTCAGVELDASFAQVVASLRDGNRRPSFGLVLAALPEAHWSALTPRGPLRHWRLIEVGAGETLTESPLSIDECVLHYLAGIPYLDVRLQGLVEEVSAPAETPPSQARQAERIAQFWAGSEEARSRFVVHLGGDERGGKLAVAGAACASLGLRLYLLRGENIPASAAEREALARLWERESALRGCALLVEEDETRKGGTALSFIESVGGMLLVSSRDPVRPLRRSLLRVDVGKPERGESQALWVRALGPAAAHVNGQLDDVISQFSLDPKGMQAAAAQVLSDSPEKEGAEFAALLWDACRVQARSRLDDLAQRLVSESGWDDLVLPAAQLQTLHEIAAQVRRRTQVYERWGFGARNRRGLGISALFAGPSGTGKTLAAEVLANDLRLDLYRIDLSQIVSKYIGETEKNLRQVFDAAEDGGAVLLFDEADALFGKRSEVKDSHDRYANIEISYLLQRMETYRGLAVLTTNMKSVLDTAFLRRLRFVVHFPFPDAEQRARIWHGAFPHQTPTEGVDAAKLARLSVAGGNIRNIAIQAAFLAAHAGEPVRMRHLLAAARAEYAKLEKTMADSECRDWL